MWCLLLLLASPLADATLGPLPPPALPVEEVVVVREVRGEASWYGREHRGRKRADGERFDERDPAACACLAWDLGTILRVTRADTGDTVIVECKDRGPYVKGRVVDLSKNAAERLDITEEGHVDVIVTEEVL